MNKETDKMQHANIKIINNILFKPKPLFLGRIWVFISSSICATNLKDGTQEREMNN